MADIAQVLATYDALVGVALGAGLTYGFGALNRRHHEKRENDTRWYEARFKTYSEFSRAVSSKVLFPANTSPTREERAGLREEFASLIADIRLVASVNVVEKAEVSIQVLADSRLVAGTVGGTSSSACIVRE